MPFDPIDFFQHGPPERPDPFASAGGQEWPLLIAAALAVCAGLFVLLFPLPLILITEAYDYLRFTLLRG
jgi:hypothetical protein